MRRLLVFIAFDLLAHGLLAQDRQVDPTWLHRHVPQLSQAQSDFASGTCHYTPIFGQGDAQSGILRSTTRFAELKLDARGICQTVFYAHEEEIVFVLEGNGILHYGEQTYSIRANDFTYLPPALKHSLANDSERAFRVLVMTFKIPQRISISPPLPQPKIVNLDDVKEENVDGHPTSVLYRLLIGPQTGKRDAIDDAYMVTSFFWMDFAPGGTNFPHHHETAEEIYLVLEGKGEMVAGSGMDGVEGRYPAQAGDAYYFRPNCTVGFYSQNKPGAKAYILAVRAWVPLEEPD